MGLSPRVQAARADEEAVCDLLADLKHFCVAANIDFDTCDRLAEVHFDAESEDVP